MGVRVLSASADEVPYVDINEVTGDSVTIVARFNPKIVKMFHDGRRPED